MKTKKKVVHKETYKKGNDISKNKQSFINHIQNTATRIEAVEFGQYEDGTAYFTIKIDNLQKTN